MVTGIDIFSSNKYECTFSTSDNVDAPIVQKKEYNLNFIDDEGFMALMDESGNMKEDLKVPEDEWLKDVTDKCREILEEGKKECIVTIVSAMGQEKLISVREGNNL